MKPEMPFRHKTIGQLLDELAREVPSLPAGGCVLALLGALASALQRFVASVARHRRNNPDVDKRLKEMISRLETLQDKCIELMDQDLAAYQKIIRITHMQENKASAQSNRQKAIQETRIRAAQPPVILMELAAEMLEMGLALIREGHEVAVADAAVAMEIAYSCLQGGSWITEANLADIADIEYIKHKRQYLKGLQKKGEDLYQKARAALKKRL